MSKIFLPVDFKITLTIGQFLDIVGTSSSYYIALGRAQRWDDELNPPNVSTSQEFETQTRKDILAMKKVESLNVTLGIVRNDWAGGVIYDHYDDVGLDLSTAKYFVINSEKNVYKCIWNNAGTASLVEPRGTPLSVFELSDGYKWKYMYTVSDGDFEKFLLPDFIPIKESTAGSSIVENILIENGGSGYPNGNYPVIISGDGIGASATAQIVGGTVVSVTLLSGGAGYSFATAALDIPSGMGSGVDFRVIVDRTLNATVQSLVKTLAVDGAINQYVVESSGVGYTEELTSINVLGDGEDAVATPIVSNGRLIGVNVVSPGFGYRRANVVVQGDGSGATVRAIISPTGGHGFDIISELYTSTILFYTSFEFQGAQSDFFVNNEFRQLSLIRSPQLFNSTAVATDVTLNACYVISFNRSINLPLDGEFFDPVDGTRLKLIEIRDTNVGFFKTVGSSLPYMNQALLSDSDIVPINITNIVEPEVDVFSGSMIFIENRTPIIRSKDQTETLKTVLSF